MSQQRRQKIVDNLNKSSKPIKGGELADILGVSRQVIVQDIALLRAQGETIVATPQGYFLIKEPKTKNVNKVFACQHDYGGMEKELKIIVANGGKVLDVVVEHPLYGELRGNLMLESLADVEEFMKNLDTSGAEPLSVLTKGIHLHTVEASSSIILDRIEIELREEQLLV